MAIQSIVFSAFTGSNMGYLGPPYCYKSGGPSLTCNPWLGANFATKATPIYVPVHNTTNFQIGKTIQYPTIGPERMVLAMYKLFGEVAIAMMAKGPGNWTSPSNTSNSSLMGLEHASDIVTGRVPYQVVMVLLIIWVAITVLPQVFIPGFFFDRRWASTLDGFAMFRFGAEWTAQVHELYSGGMAEPGTASLKRVPGMIGDMHPRRSAGAVRTGSFPLAGL